MVLSLREAKMGYSLILGISVTIIIIIIHWDKIAVELESSHASKQEIWRKATHAFLQSGTANPPSPSLITSPPRHNFMPSPRYEDWGQMGPDASQTAGFH